jgi:hypothetical protein
MTRYSTANTSYAQNGSEKSKGGDDHVKLYSDAVEVVEVSEKAEKRPSSAGATSLRLRVKSASPADVEASFQHMKGRLGVLRLSEQKER